MSYLRVDHGKIYAVTAFGCMSMFALRVNWCGNFVMVRLD